MPAAVAVPAIASVVAGVGGAALAARGSGRASKAQEDATNQALAFEREKYAFEKDRLAKIDAEQKAQWEARQQMRQALLGRYGVNGAATAYPGQGVATGGAATAARALSLASLMPQAPQQEEPMMPRQATNMASLGDWTKWGGY